MSKDVIHVGGEDVVVREDTAKSYRGVIWALLSVGMIIAIAAIMFFSGLLATLFGSKQSDNPQQIEQQQRR